MPYAVRSASVPDIPYLVRHREEMFREMGTKCDYAGMAQAFATWLQAAIPDGTYRAWVAETDEGRIVAGVGLVVMPWAPGPLAMDPRCGYVFNVFTEPEHRGRGLARRLMVATHDWCADQGIQRLALNATDAGMHIYQSLGYVVTAHPMMRLDRA